MKFSAQIVGGFDSTSAVPAIKRAIAKGIKVVEVDTVLRRVRTRPQIPGMAGSILDPPMVRGQWIGGLVVKACKGHHSLFAVKKPRQPGSSLDLAIRTGCLAWALAGQRLTTLSVGIDGAGPTQFGSSREVDPATRTWASLTNAGYGLGAEARF